MTSLSAQLARIATTEKRGSDKFATSFLFDAKQAADYDLDSIYDLGIAGLTELEQLDQQRFLSFRKTLFNASMKSYDRTLKTQEENKQLDASIALFMQCLSQYFLTRSAGKCIEWLLRRFRVNEFNTHALLAGILPFHETPQFAKLASLMKFSDDDIWSFIRALRRPIRPLARTLLVDQCIRQPSLLRIIGDQMIDAAKRGLAHKTQYNFYMATTVLTINRVPTVNNNFITLLLPDISYGLSTSAAVDNQSRITALMVLSQLASRTTFSAMALSELLQNIVVTMSKSSKESQIESTLCLMHLTNCQETASAAFNNKLTTSLIAVPNFITTILMECASKYNISSFVCLFFRGLISLDTKQGWEVAESLLRNIPLDEKVAKYAVEQLLHHVAITCSNKYDMKPFTGVTTCMERLRLLHSSTVTTTIEEALNNYRKEKKKYRIVHAYLSSTLKGTGQQLLKKTNTPLFLALNHADSDIRMIAIQQLGGIMENESPSQNMTDTEFIRSTLLARLQSEEDPETISRVLCLPKVQQWLSFDTLFDAIRRLIAADNDCTLVAAAYMVAYMPKKQHSEKWDMMIDLALPLLMQPSSPKLFATMPNSSLITRPLLKGYADLVKKHAEDPSYNAAYISLITKNLIKANNIDMVLNHLKHGNDRAILFALLTTHSWLEHTKEDQAMQLEYAHLLAQQISQLLRERLADRRFTSLAGQLLDSIARLPLEESTNELFTQLAETKNLTEFLPIGIVWAFRCIVEQLAPLSSSDICWHDDNTCKKKGNNSDNVIKATRYTDIIRCIFMAIHQEEDILSFSSVIKALFSHHLTSMPLAFLSSVWARSDNPTLVRVRSLEMASVYWANYAEHAATTTPVDFQLYLPWLMVALGDANDSLRELATQCIDSMRSIYASLDATMVESTDTTASKSKRKKKQRGTLASIYDQTTLYGTSASEHLLYLPTNEAIALTEKLMERKAEIMTDADGLSTHLAIMFNQSADSRQTETWLSFLLSSVVAEPLITLRTCLVKTLRAVHNPLKLRYLSPLALAPSSSSSSSSSSMMAYLNEFVHCFDAVSATQLNVKGSNARKVLSSLLTGSITTVNMVDNEREQLQLATLSMVDRELFVVLNEARQQQLFSQLVQLTLVNQVSIATEARRIIKDIHATSVVLVYELLQCQSILAQQNTGSASASASTTVQHSKRSKTSSEDMDNDVQSSLVTATSAIQRIIVVLELVQHREMTSDEMRLVLPLFDLLAITLSGEMNEPRSILDYVNQLILSGLTRIIRQLLQQKTAPSLDASRVRVDLVVQCLRGTNNPQIHGQALLLLASLASVQPDLVLQNIMPVFTFMGASVLRQDDNYSFHIIQQTLEKIIPPLLSRNSQENMRGLISIFVDAFFHIPRHRRLRLFTVLVNTLGADQSLHQALLLLLIKYAERMSKSTEDADTLMEFCRQLSEQCSSDIQLKMLYQLVNTLNTSPNELTDDMPELFKKLTTNKQIRQLKWATLEFARQLLESRPFLNQLLSLSSKTLETDYLTLSEALLSLVDTLFTHEHALLATGQSTTSIIKYWRGIARLANDVLNNVHRLLTLPTFMRIVSELLKHQNPSIRRKSMLLFNEKVEALDEGVEMTEKELFLGMLPHLTAMIAIKAKPKDREAIEIAINKQTALVSLALLVKHFGRTDPTAFIDVLTVITGEWALGHENRQVAASSMICLSVYCRELGPRVVPLLPKFMPTVMDYMEQQQSSSISTSSSMDISTESSSQSNTLMRLSLLGLVDVMARHMSAFIGPYLPRILRHLFDPLLVGQHGDQVSTRAQSVVQQIATHVSPRLLLSPTFNVYSELTTCGVSSLLAYYQFLGRIIESMDRTTLQQHYKPIFKFFLQLFDIRRECSFSEQSCVELETSVITAFLQLVMKLNETMFKPIFLKAVEWAMGVHVPATHQIPRQLFFYRFLDQLLEQLKSIVVPYYVYVLDDVIGKLNQTPSPTLWLLLVSSLHKCLLYDNDGFWTTHLAEKILPSIVRQLSIIHPDEDEDTYLTRMKQQLVPCLGQLAVTSGTDVIWKPLNAQVLLQTRDDQSIIRVAALDAVREFYDRLGEEFLILLPETIPFLAELMEDDDIHVERTTQQVIAVIERHLGEPLQKYFD